MANRLKLFVDWTTKALYRSDVVLEQITLPPFYQYENVPLEVVVMEPSVTQRGRWTRLDVDDFALTASLNDSLNDGSPLAVQDTFTKNSTENCVMGNLDLNVAGINTYMTADAMNPYFELSILQSDGSRQKIYLAQVTLKKGITQPTTTSPDPIQTYPTVAQLQQLFVPYILPAGKTITLVSDDGTKGQVLKSENDGTFTHNLEILTP